MPASPRNNPNTEAPKDRKFKKKVEGTARIAKKNGMIQPNSINKMAATSSCFQYSTIIYITNTRSGARVQAETLVGNRHCTGLESCAGNADGIGSRAAA